MMSVYGKILFRKFKRDERGVSALEFALVSPVFFALVFAAIQFSLSFHHSNTARWAVEKAARAAVLNGDVDEAAMQALVDSYLSSVDSPVAIDVSYTVDNSSSVPMGTLTANYSRKITVPLAGYYMVSSDFNVAVPTWSPSSEESEG